LLAPLLEKSGERLNLFIASLVHPEGWNMSRNEDLAPQKHDFRHLGVHKAVAQAFRSVQVTRTYLGKVPDHAGSP